jgi:hypothetical protein
LADTYVNSATGNDTTGNGSSGNPYATIQKGLDVHAAAGDRVIVQVGSGYTITAGLTKATNGSTPGSNQPNRLIGCTSTPFDGGRPVITINGSTITAISLSGTGWWIESFEIDCANQTSSTGISLGAWGHITNCWIRRFTVRGVDMNAQYTHVSDCRVYDGTSAATAAINLRNTQGGVIVNNDVYDNACPGILTASGGVGAIVDNRVYRNTGASSDGILFTYTNTVMGNVAHANGRDGLRCADFLLSQLVRNNVSTSNGAYGLRYTGSVTLPVTGTVDYNAFYNNTSGARDKFTAGTHDVTLSGDPYTNAAGGNFAPNNTSGAGAALRAAGIPGPTPAGTTTGYRDIGVQHQDSGGGGGGPVISGSPWII